MTFVIQTNVFVAWVVSHLFECVNYLSFIIITIFYLLSLKHSGQLIHLSSNMYSFLTSSLIFFLDDSPLFFPWRYRYHFHNFTVIISSLLSPLQVLPNSSSHDLRGISWEFQLAKRESDGNLPSAVTESAFRLPGLMTSRCFEK